jgi:hypothetical protein
VVGGDLVVYHEGDATQLDDLAHALFLPRARIFVKQRSSFLTNLLRGGITLGRRSPMIHNQQFLGRSEVERRRAEFRAQRETQEATHRIRVREREEKIEDVMEDKGVTKARAIMIVDGMIKPAEVVR